MWDKDSGDLVNFFKGISIVRFSAHMQDIMKQLILSHLTKSSCTLRVRMVLQYNGAKTLAMLSRYTVVTTEKSWHSLRMKIIFTHRQTLVASTNGTRLMEV